MAAISDSDRMRIRKYLCASAIFRQAWPKLENAMTAIQSIADGGTQPTTATQLEVIATLDKLDSLDTRLDALWDLAFVQDAEGTKLKPQHAAHHLRSDGRKYIAFIARTLDCAPLGDYYGPVAPNGNEVIP